MFRIQRWLVLLGWWIALAAGVPGPSSSAPVPCDQPDPGDFICSVNAGSWSVEAEITELGDFLFDVFDWSRGPTSYLYTENFFLFDLATSESVELVVDSAVADSETATITAVYSDAGGLDLQVAATLTLSATAEGSRIDETIRLDSGSTSPGFGGRLYVLSNFDLGGGNFPWEGDTAMLTSPPAIDSITQLNGATNAVVVVTPEPGAYEIGDAFAVDAVSLRLYDAVAFGGIVALRNISAPVPPEGDYEFAWSWDPVLGANDSFQVDATKTLTVPEPHDGLLAVSALLTLAGLARRRAGRPSEAGSAIGGRPPAS